MPSEHDGARDRQIEALQRYVAELGTQRERATQLGVPREPPTQLGVPRDRPIAEVATPRPAPEGRRRPPLSWLLVTVVLLAAALLGGVFLGAAAWSDDRSPVRGTDTTTAPTTQAPGGVALVASPECKTAVDRANKVLAVAVRMRAAVVQHTTVASGDPASFDRALAEYRQVVDRCTLRTP
jgi:hypothetical protein